MDRRTKEKVVAELHEKLKDTTLAVLAGYTGMNVEKLTVLRNTLRKSGTELRVVKNTLLGIASENTDFSGLKEYFKGPLAILLNRGDVSPADKGVSRICQKERRTGNKGWHAEWQIIEQGSDQRAVGIAEQRSPSRKTPFRYGRSPNFVG